MYAKLEKISGGKGLRTEVVEGDCMLPEIGKSFSMFAKSLSPDANVRAVVTSPVVAFDTVEDNVYEITTATGSQYRLTTFPN